MPAQRLQIPGSHSYRPPFGQPARSRAAQERLQTAAAPLLSWTLGWGLPPTATQTRCRSFWASCCFTGRCDILNSFSPHFFDSHCAFAIL